MLLGGERFGVNKGLKSRKEGWTRVSAEGGVGMGCWLTFHLVNFGVLRREPRGQVPVKQEGGWKGQRLIWCVSETQERETHPGNSYFEPILIKMVEQ